MGSLYVVVANEQDCNIIVSEFKLQSCYDIHFWTNTLGQGMKPLTKPSYRLSSITTVLLQRWPWD